MTVKALLQQGSPVYLNPGVDLFPGKKYSDDEIRKYVEGARKAHTHSGTGKSIDVFVRKGTKVPVSLTQVGPTYGNGGVAGFIQGTDTFIGHLTPNSKSGLAEKKGEIKGTEAPNMDLEKEDKTKPKGVKKPGTPQQVAQEPVKAQQVASKPATVASSQMMQVPQMSSMVAPAAPSQVPQIAQYPSYSQSQYYIIDRPSVIAMGGGGGSSQPVYIPSGGGDEGRTITLPGPSEGEVVNSLIKTLLLTNLSAS